MESGAACNAVTLTGMRGAQGWDFTPLPRSAHVVTRRLSPTPSDQQDSAKDRDASDHGPTRVGRKGSQGIQTFARVGFYLRAPQRARRELLPTPYDQPGCAMDRDASDHAPTRGGGKGSEGIQTFSRMGFYPACHCDGRKATYPAACRTAKYPAIQSVQQRRPIPLQRIANERVV